MNRKLLPRLLLLISIVSAAVVGFVWLYRHSANIDAAQHQRILALSEQVKQLDARWNVDVLRSATDLNKDYDPLVRPLLEWPGLREQLRSESSALHLDAVDASLKRVDELVAQKAVLLNQFKARNAVLKNSLRYLPTAQAEIGAITGAERDRSISGSRSVATISGKVDEALRSLSASSTGDSQSAIASAKTALQDLRGGLQGAMRDSRTMQNAFAMTGIESAVGSLVSSALRFNLSPDVAEATALTQLNASIKSSLSSYPITLKDSVSGLTTHVDVVLRERNNVATLLATVSAVPIADAIDALVSSVNAGFASHVAQQATYQRLFQAYVVVLLLCLVVGAFMLIRHWQLLSVDVRTSRERLKTAELRLVQADRLATLGQMSSSIAHEINTPLAAAKNAISMISEMFKMNVTPLLETSAMALSSQSAAADSASAQSKAVMLVRRFQEEVRPDYEECLVDGLSAVEQIRAVVENLRDFSRSDQGRISTVSLEREVSSTLKMLGSVIKGRAIQVETRYGLVPTIECNAAAIRQVLLNIIKNAAEAMPTGGHITIETKPQSRHAVAVTIVDDGIGMAPDVLDRIFEPNFTTKSDGFGIGLSISRDIVVQHSGEIQVKSVVGSGTTFTIILPVKATSNLVEAEAANDSRIGGQREAV